MANDPPASPKLPSLQDFIAPFMNFWGQGNAGPLSGDVSQLFRIFSPTITVDGQGDPELEARIVRDVATYGAQIGQLSEIVLALAGGKAPPTEAMTKLSAIAAEIARVKTEYRAGALRRAKAALSELESHDRDGYEALVASLKTQR